MSATSIVAPTEIQTGLERFKKCAEASYAWRAESLEDLKFSTGDQWDIGIRTVREKNNKPCLTMDQIQQSVRLVCNQYRQQPPAIQINPIGNGADQETAEVEQGIIRHIELLCDAQTTYENTHEFIVRIGFGSCRILSDYVDEETDEQEISVDFIENPFAVYWQPGVKQQKAKYCFITEDVDVEQYKDDYPDSKMSSLDLTDLTAIGDSTPGWANKDTIRVAEYFTIEEVDRGKSKRPGKKVVWRKMNAIEVLDGPKDLPGTSIPVFTGYGDDIDVDGKRYIAGLVRNAKGPQKFFNYLSSKEAETMALGVSAPWIVAEGQVDAYQQEWEHANDGSLQVLHYKQVDVAGKPAPPPQRNSVEPPIQAISQMGREALINLKASMGIYDPSLGQRKGDESGTAIQQLQQQGSIATLNFADNMTRMMKRLGRSLLEWIPAIYTEPMVKRIINPDGSVGQVVIHNGADQQQDAEKLAEEQNISKIYDIGVGRYDVAVSVGKTYQSKRQEAVDTQIQLLKVLPPQIVPLVADIPIRNMDIPQAKEFADRLKKMLPPQLQDGDDSDPEVRASKAEAQLQQLGQQHQQLAQVANQMAEEIKTKKVEQDAKVQIAQMQEMSKQEITRMQEATKLSVAQINASKDANQSFAENEIEKYKIMHDAAHDVALQSQQHEHEAAQAQAAQSAAAKQQESAQQADAAQASQSESQQGAQ